MIDTEDKDTKSFYSYVYEIDSGELLKGLLANGLFTDRIPPILSSEAFYDYYFKEGMPDFKNIWKDYIRYESMRNINVPRLLSIPNPFAYANLCKCIYSNWDDLKLHFQEKTINQSHKISRIHLRKMKNKEHLFEMNYNNWTHDKDPSQDLKIRSRYKVEADISNCFPSIYSHSIEWAIKGKKEAKDGDIEKWCKDLDKCVRNTKYGETNGVLVGPHSSNLISEIILSAIDCELEKKGYKYIRYIDDYTCYVDSYEKAEDFLLDLSKELKEYELTLNHRKTKIIELPISTGTSWVNKLNSFYFGGLCKKEGKQVLKLNRLKVFLDLAIELAKENNNTAVINYAIQIVSKKHLDKKELDFYIKEIHHLLLIYPYLVHLVDEFVFNSFNVDKETICIIGNDLYEVGVNKRLYEACSFSLYWSIKHGYKIKDEYISKEIAEESKDCIFMLFVFLYMKQNNNNNELKKMKKLAEELSENNFDRYWLFIYEVLPVDKFKDEYERMKRGKVSFIKDEIWDLIKG